MAGTSHLSATGDTLALTRFLELVSTVAIALGRLGDPDPLPVRRAKAVGIIADPDELADLLTRADHVEHGPDAQGPDETGTGSPAPNRRPPTPSRGSRNDPSRDGRNPLRWHVDRHRVDRHRVDRHRSRHRSTDTGHRTESSDRVGRQGAAGTDASDAASGASPGKARPAGSGSQARPSTGVVGGLLRKPARVKLYVHLSAADLATMATSTGESVVIGEVERLGPATLTKIRDWLKTSGATITPVIDLNRTEARDLHDPPAWMRELVILRDGHCVFPWCATDARSCDIDHIEPFHHGQHDDRADGNRASPGQTHPDGLACLCRLCRIRDKRHYADRRIMPTGALVRLFCKGSGVGVVGII